MITQLLTGATAGEIAGQLAKMALGREVHIFNEDPRVPIFMVQLEAGSFSAKAGDGLSLTGKDLMSLNKRRPGYTLPLHFGVWSVTIDPDCARFQRGDVEFKLFFVARAEGPVEQPLALEAANVEYAALRLAQVAAGRQVHMASETPGHEAKGILIPRGKCQVSRNGVELSLAYVDKDLRKYRADPTCYQIIFSPERSDQHEFTFGPDYVAIFNGYSTFTCFFVERAA